MQNKEDSQPSRFVKRLWIINILILLIAVLLLVTFNDQLEWSKRNIFLYMDNDIPASDDRRAYSFAAHAVKQGNATLEHRKMLEEAIVIDPNSEATMWLGVYYVSVKDDEKGLKYLLEFMRRDPSHPRVAYHAARILNKQGKQEEALAVLNKCISYLEQRVKTHESQEDYTADNMYNKKAVDYYNFARTSLKRLYIERKKLSAQGAPTFLKRN